MGIRFNALNNALPSLRMEGVQSRPPAETLPANVSPTGGIAQPSLTAAEPLNGRLVAPFPPNNAGGQRVTSAVAPAQEQGDMPMQPLEAAIEADGKVDGLQQALNQPAARVRAFRFLMAAESVRGRELEARYDQLEHRLSTVNARLQRAESIMVQIDARLERARLQHDLEMVAGDIRRFRLEHAFEASASVPETVEPEPPEPSQSGPATSQPSAPTRQPVLNLFA
ncbi:MAG: hypothetical protein C4532_19620 [Candidatus Abyssobacteria bacterium SURF_17]|uniref:Uncharacterized protein n=1 Tax=Candidatus Abyssobacteria bacterium SURF_17 TaxID=2093361 RepID=A0A419ENK6_9BACT|nr:MAG: hypothetical protein C4532_19620 [Candidatus Abyssubacteria bacterium SURF_17]